MQVKKLFNRSVFVWVLLFVLGTVAGAFAYRLILPQMMPLLKLGFKAAGELDSPGGLKMVVFIFLKNALVVLLCVLLGRATKGVFPAAVCFLNGGILGFLGAILARYGNVAWWKYVIALSPHGVIELAAVFLGCAIGMAALTRREKLALLKYPLAMLAVAACIETWISTLIANKII